MFSRHTIAYTILVAVHLVAGVAFTLDGTVVHGICALVAAVAYGTLGVAFPVPTQPKD